MRSRQEHISHMLGALETPTKGLTNWEQSFIESLTDQWDRSGHLSDRQVEILEKIYDEKG
jgi:hypothetical protein